MWLNMASPTINYSLGMMEEANFNYTGHGGQVVKVRVGYLSLNNLLLLVSLLALLVPLLLPSADLIDALLEQFSCILDVLRYTVYQIMSKL